MSSKGFLSWPEIEEKAKELTISMNKNKEEIYTAIKQDPVFEDYIVKMLARIMALAIARIKDREAEEWEEPEINPCRGCRDYDGRGGCISNGGCAKDEVKE